MSVVDEFKPLTDPNSETRQVLGPGGNRVRVSETERPNKKGLMKKKTMMTTTPPMMNQQTRMLVTRLERNSNASMNSSCCSDTSSNGSSVKIKNSRRRMVDGGVKSSGKVVMDDGVDDDQSQLMPPERPIVVKRCDWITPNSDPLYASFHDEEWGIPVHDDNKLFELLILSEALAELSWPAILHQRDVFRKLFDNFDPISVAKFTEKKILALKASSKSVLSEPKLRAVVENAKQMLKVQQEFGSFNNYCWSFVNHKTIKNGHRYARQVPVKTPKAEVMSKDLMRRGFRCVGPTVVYSFMQVAGIVNDHLVTCFRYQECDSSVKRDTEVKIGETELAKALVATCLSPV
ncbi:Methyladenine glycosylase [Thalictrum thalictroides]|uniref:Methyladenine glycosylase n=1 Tax=Thalictrum thalictroides TaxID=46969 RepID=A0A7J6VVQ9_THATH|nr:Methyladenine glycosylase [Thalictrum thalictroides]